MVLSSTPQTVFLVPSECRWGGDCWVSPSVVTLGLMEVLPDDCVQVGKKELMYAGTVGLIIYLGGVIFINRKSTTSAKMVMAEVAKTMAADKVSVTVGLGGVACVWVSWGGMGDVELLVLAHLELQPPAALGKAGWWLSQQEGSTANGLLEQSLISPCAGEGVGVPRGHKELHWGSAAIQERSISPGCPGTGNSALLLHGAPEFFCSGTVDWSCSGMVYLLSSELCSQVTAELLSQTTIRCHKCCPAGAFSMPCRSDLTPVDGWLQTVEKLPLVLSSDCPSTAFPGSHLEGRVWGTGTLDPLALGFARSRLAVWWYSVCDLLLGAQLQHRACFWQGARWALHFVSLPGES